MPNFTRSAMAPAISATVMVANMAWKATKLIAGKTAAGSSVIKLFSPANSVRLPTKPLPTSVPNVIE